MSTATKAGQQDPYEATKHLSEANALAWQGDRLPEDSAYRSDGHTLVRRADVVPETGIDRIPYGEHEYKTLSDDESADTVWGRYVSSPQEEAVIVHVVDVSAESALRGYDMVAQVETESGETVYVNAHKVRLACYWTRPDCFRVGADGKALIFYREENPVGVVMALRTTWPEMDVIRALNNDD